jgi:2-methylcitrate dehydratase PrpD
MYNTPDPSRRLAAHVSATGFDHLTDTAIQVAKRSTLDTFGAMLAGSSAPGIDTVVAMARGWGGNPEATIFGHNLRLPAPMAAWCNGSMARALEVDDCVDFLPVHPSASCVPALMALAELRGGMSGRDFLTALAVGQDVIIRMGLTVRKNAMQSGRNNRFKIFGPAAAIANAMGQDVDKTLHTLGISFSHAVGDGQCAIDGALSLRLQQGIVAQGALLSGLLSEQGYTGARDFLTGPYGYLTAFEPDPRLEYLENPGERFWGEEISIKPYATCRATHAGIDLALDWRAKAHGKHLEFSQIKIEVSPEVDNLVGSPREKHLRPASPAAAQFSMLYAVAAALVRGRVSIEEIQPSSFTDKIILDIAERISVSANAEMRTDKVVGCTKFVIEEPGGKKTTIESADPSGSATRPISFDKCAEKFSVMAANTIKPLLDNQKDEIVELVSRLETLDDVSALATRLG